MKCKICGAKLKKDGDICKNCYKAYLEEEELKKDINKQLRIKESNTGWRDGIEDNVLAALIKDLGPVPRTYITPHNCPQHKFQGI